MNNKPRKTIELTPEQRAQHRAIREAFRDWHPGPEELIASGEAARLGLNVIYSPTEELLQQSLRKQQMDRHPNKEIEAALKYAKSQGWSIIKSPKGHCWGMIRCPQGRGGCQKSVWSTPKNPKNHADAIRRFVDHCPH